MNSERHREDKLEPSVGVRNRKVISMAQAGTTLAEIGVRVGITRERVRQILKEARVASPHEARQLKRDAVARASLRKSKEIGEWILAHPGCYLSEVARQAGTSPEKCGDIIPDSVFRLILNSEEGQVSAKKKGKTLYSEDAILESLRKAAKFKSPLSHNAYSKLRSSGRIKGPSAPRVMQVFGTWSTACELAGVMSGINRSFKYSRRWSKAELAELVADYLMNCSRPSAADFDTWCQQDESRPSLGTVRNQLGPWTSAHRAALIHLRKSWTEREKEAPRWKRDD